MSERERFEQWARDTYGVTVNFSSAGGIYADPFVMALFTGWQARARIAEQEKRGLVEALAFAFSRLPRFVRKELLSNLSGGPPITYIESYKDDIERVLLAKHKTGEMQ